MSRRAILRPVAALLFLAVAAAALAQADPAPPDAAQAASSPGQAALRKLRDTLAFDGDPRAIVDARVQIDAMLAKPDAPPDTTAMALRSLSGRVDAALAARPVPAAMPQTPLPMLGPWWRIYAGTLAPAALLAAFAILSGLVAIAVPVLVGRRLLVAGATAQAAMQAGGKLFESAARRFMQAQDDAASTADAALAAATQAGQAASRLTGAARDVEARLRAVLADADGRGRGADTLAYDIRQTAEALPAILAQAVHDMTGLGLSAIEDAAVALREGTLAATTEIVAEAGKLPQLVADAILAVAARGLPAIEDATSQLTSRAEDIALAAGAMQTAATSLAANHDREDASLARLEAVAANTATDERLRDLLEGYGRNASAQADALGTIAAATLANADRTALCLDGMQAAAQPPGLWQTGLAALAEATGTLQQTVGELAACRTPVPGAPPDETLLDGLVARIGTALAEAKAARAEDVAGAALLMEALSVRADAALGQLPVQADALAATAAQLRADAFGIQTALTNALLIDLPNATHNLLSAGSALADRGRQDAGVLSATRQATLALQDASQGLTLALQDTSQGLTLALQDTSQGLTLALQDTSQGLALALQDTSQGLALALQETNQGLTLAVDDTRQGLALQDAAFGDTARLAATAIRDSAAQLHNATEAAGARLRSPDGIAQAQIARLAELLDGHDRRLSGHLAAEAFAASAPRPDDGGALRQAQLEAAIAQIQNAAVRVLDGAGAQEQASARVADAARQVVACLARPVAPTAPPLSLSRLNELAAEADSLHAEADRLATAAMRGDGRDLPASLPQETASLLASIESSIGKLRGTATALALASDAVRAAA